jgi:hypothetical protein
MSDSDKNVYQTFSEPIEPHSQVSSCIDILNFREMIQSGEISRIQVFYERIVQEIYNTRKKNYSWGFRVIEPDFNNFSERMVLVSKLYREEELKDLNSVVFKLFVEFNNIILSTALHMHIPIRGIIQIGDAYRGNIRSRRPAVVSGKDPLILSDLLKVFSIGEIFPTGFSEGLIPAVDIPFHFGADLCGAYTELHSIESIGIFMPLDFNRDNTADVTILSNMMVKAEVNGEHCFVCNWKEWMSEHTDCSTENVIAFAESEAAKPSDSHGKKWHSLVRYSVHL